MIVPRAVPDYTKLGQELRLVCRATHGTEGVPSHCHLQRSADALDRAAQDAAVLAELRKWADLSARFGDNTDPKYRLAEAERRAQRAQEENDAQNS